MNSITTAEKKTIFRKAFNLASNSRVIDNAICIGAVVVGNSSFVQVPVINAAVWGIAVTSFIAGFVGLKISKQDIVFRTLVALGGTAFMAIPINENLNRVVQSQVNDEVGTALSQRCPEAGLKFPVTLNKLGKVSVKVDSVRVEGADFVFYADGTSNVVRETNAIFRVQAEGQLLRQSFWSGKLQANDYRQTGMEFEVPDCARVDSSYSLKPTGSKHNL